MVEYTFPKTLDNAKLYTIRLPKGLPWRPEPAYSLMIRLSSLEQILCQIVADYSGIRWQVLDVASEQSEDVFAGAVLATYPEATVEASKLEFPPLQYPFHRHLRTYKQVTPFIAPLRYASELREYDPLVGMTNLMGELLPDERITFLLYLWQQDPALYDEAQKLLKRGEFETFLRGTIAGALGARGGASRERYVPDLQKTFESKVNDLLYRVHVLSQIDTPNHERLVRFRQGLGVPLWELSSDFQVVMFDEKMDQVHEVKNERDASETHILAYLRSMFTPQKMDFVSIFSGEEKPTVEKTACVFNPQELAALWHLPHEHHTASTIEWVTNKQVRVPANLRRNTSGVCLGNNVYAGVPTPVYMLDDDRTDHMILVGKTGVGKSELMHQMIRRDIERGSGVAVIDPEGTLIADILRYSIPKQREADVVVWDIGNTDYPPPLNPLVVSDPENRSDAAADLMDIFSRMERGFSGMRMANDLGDILETLMTADSVTLRDIEKLLDDDEYRDLFIENLQDDAAFNFWAEVDEMKVGERRQRFSPFAHRLRNFYRGRVLYPIICHPEGLDLNTLIANNKIILVSLKPKKGAHVSGKQLDLIGSMIVSQFQTAISEDAATRTFYMYVDEADRFVTTSIDEMYKRARKRKLSLTLATQYLAQLAGPTLDAIFGNTGAIVAFKVGEPDARTLSSYMSPSFAKEDLVKFSRFQAAIFMKYHGEQLPAFSFETVPVPKPEIDERDPNNPAERIRRKSVEQHTPLHRDHILAWLEETYPRRRSRRRQNRDETDREAQYSQWEEDVEN